MGPIATSFDAFGNDMIAHGNNTPFVDLCNDHVVIGNCCQRQPITHIIGNHVGALGNKISCPRQSTSLHLATNVIALGNKENSDPPSRRASLPAFRTY